MTTIDLHIVPDALTGDDERTRVCLVDVRTPAEFDGARIPGSHNVPLADLDRHASELGRLDRPVVLICRTGRRAEQAHEVLAKAGLADVRVLAGGIVAWDDGERAVERGVARWDLERQVRLVAGSIVLAGILASLKAPRVRFLSGAVGAGLVFAAATDTCAMGNVLSRLPYNNPGSNDPAATVRDLLTPTT